MKRAAKPHAKPQTKEAEATRPTIALQSVIATDTASFSGWGPKVTGLGNVLKNWN